MLIKYGCVIFILQICVSCAKNSSLTFVIDDTLSMQDDINQVRRVANKIMDVVTRKKGSEIKNVVLVTFNDPEVVFRKKTSKKKELVDALDEIVVHNPFNYDCPEYALSGIIEALERSEQESYLYVFTDASAIDHNRLHEVKRLCEKKQSQVVFVLTGDCEGYVGEEVGSLEVYYEIARASNGLVFRVSKYEVIDIVDTIPDIIAEQRSVITSKFTVDDKTEYVSIHTSGENVELFVTDKSRNEMNIEETLWKPSVKMAKFHAPGTGTYYAWVKGNTDITIVVYAKTDFTFDHGFSEFVPHSLADASKQPIADRAHHLSISVTDPEHTVYIKSAEILDMNEKLIKTLPLSKASGDFYITAKFISPSDMFKVQVTGTVKRTGKDIKRISKTAIEPQIPPRPDPKAPVVKITEGPRVEVDYGGSIILTCKVSGYPTPRIWWTSADGTTVSTKSNAVELPYDYISYLNLSNVRYPGKYYCKAQNEEASELTHVAVNPKSPFKVQDPPGKTPVKYGEKKEIRCDISSSLPMDIKWKTPLRPENYSLSADKKVLTINSVNLIAQGSYVCEATLRYNRRQKQAVTTDVLITNLAPPTISPTADPITVSHGEEVHIKCKLTGGVPRPTISWKIVKNNDFVYKGLVDTGEELVVANTTLADAGMYQCIAQNELGVVRKSIELIVQVPPAVVIEEGSKKSVAYESSHVITCKVVAFPPPTIGWKNSDGKILPSQVIKKTNEMTSRLHLKIRASDTYICFAENTIGKADSSIDIEMMSPFVVLTHPGGITSSKFGSKTDITCDVTSDHPMRIRWFFKSSSGVSEVRTSDKYKLSATGTTLSILYTDVASVGTYSCEASLAGDKKQKIAFTTNVLIDDLAPPVLQDTHPEVLTVKSNDKVKIPCIIVAGNPPPVVSWQVMKKGEESFKKLSASSQELVIDSAALSDAGVYRCDARNVKGQAHKTTELIVQMPPAVVIEEGSKKSVEYESSHVITCKVVAYPPPRIGWKNSDGKILPSQEIKKTNEITSRLNLLKIKASDTYTCFAKNTLGKADSSINIEMMSPFVVLTHPGGVTSSKFGSKTDITCDVTSDRPMRIRWFFKSSSGVSEVRTSDKYELSAAGTTLSILYTDVASVGTYSCEASLAGDEKQKIAFTTNVVIDDLAPPVLQDTHPKVLTVKSNTIVKITCTIVAGNPPPVLSWQVMKEGEESFKELSASGQELVIDNAALSDAGVYRCDARNVKGQTHKSTELVVQTPPMLVIEEGTNKTVAYESSHVITCEIVAYPLPRIRWKNREGKILPSQEIKKKNKITSRLNLRKILASDTYTCFAENTLGNADSSIDIEMMSPFVVLTHPGGVTSSKFGSKTDITCDVTSDHPMRIRWFFKSSSGVSEVRTSDKYKLSATGTTLSILYTDVASVGTYSCEASLAGDEKQKIAFTTNVLIDDLAPPVLQDTHPKVLTVKSSDKVKIPCIIVAGNPPPVVSWQVMKKGEESFKEMSTSGQELVIDSAALSDAGVYRCDAKNVKGQAHINTELVVQQAPKAFIAEKAVVNVPYRGNKEFTCHIVAFPLPKISWRDSKGNELHAMDNVDKNEVISRLQVNNIKLPDTYTCYASNDLGETKVAVQVSVLPSIDFSIHPPVTTNVKYEEPATLFCDAKSSFPMKINWYYQKDELSPRSEIVTSDRIMISADERVLLIISMGLDLVGKYTCEASLVDDKNETKSYTTNVKINDLEAPVITYSNDTITVMKGDLMTAFCIADGNPKPVLTWQFKSKVSDVFTDLSDKGERISVPKIGYEKSGLYRCTATNVLGEQSQNIDVVVHGEPTIVNTQSEYFGVTGDKALKIPCEVDSVPEPTIIWTIGGKVVTSDKKLAVNKNSLYIKNPTEKDSNNFTCEAKNIYGYDKKTFTADISDFITYNEDLNSNIYLKVGESTEIKCLLPHSDPQSIRWYVNGENSKVIGTFYSIKNAQFSNDGNYTCRLNTEEGSESLNYVVDVGYKPSFMTTPPATIDWKGDTDDTLDCYVRAKPRVKVQWFYNGKLLDATLPGVAIFGWGQYTCKVSNVHDRVERTFNVTSSGCLINRTAINAENIPLFVDDELNNWPALATKKEFYTISKNEMITLECATQNQPDNTFKALTNAKKINAKCYREDTFIVDGKMYKINDLHCKTYVKSSQVLTKKPCMKKGKVIDIGFELTEGFLSVYEVCYSGLDHKILYTKLVMSAASRGNIVAPAFKHPGTKGGHGTEPRKCAYSTRRLVIPEDVAFGPAQAATLSDEYNAVPVYEPCEEAYRLSWSGVEKTVELASYNSDGVTVWTGASQYDTSGIPRYLWKVVLFDDDTFETIVFVNAASPSSSDVLCPDTVPDRFTDVTDAGDQYTYICSMDDFLKAFKVPFSDFMSTS